MTDNFTASLGFVLRHECVFAPGHANDPLHVITENVSGDSGGLTKFGIDAASHPGVDIAALTLEQATRIYHDGEWTRCRCDDLPEGVDTAVFDAAVNCGPGTAGRMLQEAINGCGYAVVVDGQIGSKTVGAATAICMGSRWTLITPLLQLRRDHYGNLVKAHAGLQKFLRGWLNRVDDLETFIRGGAQ